MNIETRAPKTGAEAEIAKIYETARGKLRGSAAVRELREEAFAAFQAKGLPHRRVEEWKYSDLRARLKTASPLSEAASTGQSRETLDATNTFGAMERYRIVLDGGRLVDSLSDIEALKGEGVAVRDLNEVLEGAEGRQLLLQPEIAEGDITVALNTALCQGGAVVSVTEGRALSRPIEIVQLASAGGSLYSRCRIALAKGAKATVLESFQGGANVSEVNAVMSYEVADEGDLKIVRLLTGDNTHVSSCFVRLGGKAKVKALGFNAGTGFARSQSFVTFAGENSRADLLGVTMVRGTQHSDQTLLVDHAVPHCDSRELFKAVIDDRAEGVFQGKIIVRPHAQKTDGRMMTQALLLSEEASMSNKPELEIFADDVQCAHGATSGQIDEDLLFYLRARGIPEKQARMLLILAFLAEAVEQIEDEAIVAALEGRVRQWLSVEE